MERVNEVKAHGDPGEHPTQAQKLEAIGRLTGGVVHDFNNMLSVILGYAELGLMKIDDPAHPLHADLQEILKAANHSADLTRQLLAFARQQPIAPQAISLNEAVGAMIKMLTRLIGEDIDFQWRPSAGIWPITMDPSQIDQILVNLCVNARDAITGWGRITIETANTIIGRAHCLRDPDAAPGKYVRLTVSDNGCGMDRATQTRIFDPFFTTKGEGKGTGLGLATVYGIVRQNKGFMETHSEPGRGTTFRMYLPRHEGNAERPKGAIGDSRDRQGNETIMVVEDEPATLRTAQTVLESSGYRVLSASSPTEAIRIAHEQDKDRDTGIQLLLSDVILPEMNGKELEKIFLSLYPGIKCVFMSGYTGDTIASLGVMADLPNFIQKPFTIQALNAKVRAALDTPPSTTAAPQ